MESNRNFNDRPSMHKKPQSYSPTSNWKVCESGKLPQGTFMAVTTKNLKIHIQRYKTDEEETVGWCCEKYDIETNVTSGGWLIQGVAVSSDDSFQFITENANNAVLCNDRDGKRVAGVWVSLENGDIPDGKVEFPTELAYGSRTVYIGKRDETVGMLVKSEDGVPKFLQAGTTSLSEVTDTVEVLVR